MVGRALGVGGGVGGGAVKQSIHSGASNRCVTAAHSQRVTSDDGEPPTLREQMLGDAHTHTAPA